MSDDNGISYSYNASPSQPATAPPTEEPLYAFCLCDQVPMGNGGVLLLDRASGRQAAVAPEVATALTYCATFRTLPEHAQDLVDTLPQLQGQTADAARVLAMVRDAGLMLDAGAVATRLAQAPSAPASLAPTRVFVITCDRPEALARLLESMLRSSRPGKHDELILVDDSRQEGNRARNRELVADFNCSSPKNMRYLGARARDELLAQLIAEHPGDEAGIRFLLDRERWSRQRTYGLARNLCLLMSVGYRCIVLDDDTLCRTVLPPERGSGISFGGGDSRRLASFESEQALMTQASYDETDPLLGHARCLGMTLGQAIAELSPTGLVPTDLRGVNAALLDTLDADSPLLVSQCGSWGDPGVPGCSWLTSLDEDSIYRLLSTSGGLAGAIENRHFWLGRQRPNISKMAVMSQATGLDNTALLPPYFPAGRGEDYLFAAMLVQLHPASAVLDYDWCVPHLPLEQRGSVGTATPAVPRGNLGLCARYLADRVDYHRSVSAQTRLAGLVAQLRDLAEREPSSLLATFRSELARQQAESWQRINTRLQGDAARDSSEWQGFLRRGTEVLADALQAPARPGDIPEVPEGMEEPELLSLLATGIGEFAGALEAWPRLRDSAARIGGRLLEGGELQP